MDLPSALLVRSSKIKKKSHPKIYCYASRKVPEEIYYTPEKFLHFIKRNLFWYEMNQYSLYRLLKNRACSNWSTSASEKLFYWFFANHLVAKLENIIFSLVAICHLISVLPILRCQIWRDVNCLDWILKVDLILIITLIYF